MLSGTAFGSSWMDSSRKRLIFLGAVNLIVAVCLFSLPFINQFMLMITRKFQDKSQFLGITILKIVVSNSSIRIHDFRKWIF